MPAGQQIALQPALAGVFGEDLHHPAVRGPGARRPGRVSACHALPLASKTACSRLEAVSSGPTSAEVAALRGVGHDLSRGGRRGPGWVRAGWRRACRRARRTVPGRQRQVAQQQAAVGVRVGAEPRVARRGRRPAPAAAGGPSSSKSSSGRYERSHSSSWRRCSRVVADAGQRDLVGAPGALHRQRRRPRRARSSPSGCAARSPASAAARWRRPRGRRAGTRRCGPGRCPWPPAIARCTVDRVVAGDVDGLVAVSAQQLVEFGLGEPGQHRRVGDLVAVEVQDRQDGAVVHRVEELVGVPGRRPAARSPPRRRRSRRPPAGPGCRARRRRRGRASSRARRPRGWSRASPGRRGWARRRGRRTAGTAGPCPSASRVTSG